MDLNHVTLPTTDFHRGVAFYQALGLTLLVHSPPRYARFTCPAGTSTLSLHSVDAVPAASGVVTYFECEDLDARVARLAGAGIAFDQLPRDETWDWREARLRDPSGNVLCLFRAGDTRRDPPWRVRPPGSPDRA